MDEERCAIDGYDDSVAKKRKRYDYEKSTEDLFKGFRVIRILNENAQQKTTFIHGRFDGSNEDAVLLLEKTPFSENTVVDMLKSPVKIKTGLKNDIYKMFELVPAAEYSALKSTLIYPATAKHLSKYSSQKYVMVNETPDDYQRVVVPYIESSSFSRQWVYNILDKQSEVERILFEDEDPLTGFVLVPDMKWNGKQIEDLYLVAFVQDRRLHSLRCLSSVHIPLLHNIREKGSTVIMAKYGVPKSYLRIYVHYQPSYYHLHVHFTHLHYDAPGSAVGRAHLLDDVINNLELLDDFYQRKTLTYILRENDDLYRCFERSRKP